MVENSLNEEKKKNGKYPTVNGSSIIPHTN
jgi:hypothetical protein